MILVKSEISDCVQLFQRYRIYHRKERLHCLSFPEENTMKKMYSAFLAAVFMIATIGAASAAESPDAGDTWNTATAFSLENCYTFVDGGFSVDPVDQVDWWVSSTPNAGDRLELFLNSVAYNGYVSAKMYSNNNNVTPMQCVYKGDGGDTGSYYLNQTPVRVCLEGHNLTTIDYTFVIAWNDC